MLISALHIPRVLNRSCHPATECCSLLRRRRKKPRKLETNELRPSSSCHWLYISQTVLLWLSLSSSLVSSRCRHCVELLCLVYHFSRSATIAHFKTCLFPNFHFSCWYLLMPIYHCQNISPIFGWAYKLNLEGYYHFFYASPKDALVAQAWSCGSFQEITALFNFWPEHLIFSTSVFQVVLWGSSLKLPLMYWKVSSDLAW